MSNIHPCQPKGFRTHTTKNFYLGPSSFPIERTFLFSPPIHYSPLLFISASCPDLIRFRVHRPFKYLAYSSSQHILSLFSPLTLGKLVVLYSYPYLCFHTRCDTSPEVSVLVLPFLS